MQFLFPVNKNTNRFPAEPHVLFIIIAALCGLMYTIVNLPFKAPDELAHFYRSYQVSRGVLFADQTVHPTGGALPVSLKITDERIREELWPSGKHSLSVQSWESVSKIKLMPNRTMFIPFNNSAGYPFTLYAAQALAISIGRMFELSPLWLMYLSRIGNFLLWLAITALAIRITPVLKWSFFLIALMPQTLYMATSSSADTPTNAAAMLFTAAVLYCRTQDKLTGKMLTALVLATLYLLSTKTGYFILTGLFFLIPLSRFRSRRFYIVFTCLYFLLSGAVTAAWRSTSSGIYLDVPGVSMPDQTAFVLHNPVQLLIILARTLKHKSLFYAESFTGYLSYYEVRLAVPVLAVYVLFLLISPWLDRPFDLKLTWLERSWTGLLVAVNFFLILTMLYIWWTPVGDPVIEGPQGRYFIPLAPAALVMIRPARFNVSSRHVAWGLSVVAFSVNIYAVWRILAVHWH